jgi:hypothetical protein
LFVYTEGGGGQETGTVLWTSNCEDLQVAFIPVLDDFGIKEERNGLIKKEQNK